MVRDLIDDWRRLRRRLLRSGPKPRGVSASLVCGEMIGDTLGGLLHEWSDLTTAEAVLVPISNRFFGPRVRVSGLLTGQDIIANAHRYTGDIIILPSVMLDKTGTRLLDGYTPDELAGRLGKPV